MKSTHKTLKLTADLPFIGDVAFLDRRVKQQIDFLNQCIDGDATLATALKAQGKSYDDLIYTNNHRQVLRDTRYYTLEDFAERSNNIPVVSFFSGAGGLDIGLEAAGFSHSLLIEKVPLFCETIKSNRPRWDVNTGDISNTDEMIEMVSSRIGNQKNLMVYLLAALHVNHFLLPRINDSIKMGTILKELDLHMRQMEIYCLSILN